MPFFASAETVDDPTVTVVTLDSLSSTTPGATGVTATVSFTTNATITAETGFYIQLDQTDCYLWNWEECQYDFSDLTTGNIGGVAGTLDTGATDGNVLLFRNTGAMAAGDYTVTIGGLTNPDYHGGIRALVSTPESDTSGLSGRIMTKSDPLTLGDILVKGTVKDSGGDPIETYGQIHDNNWNVNNHFNADEWGFYAVRKEGFSSGDKVFLTVYPDTENTGLATFTSEFTYNGTTITKNIVPPAASKTVNGSIKYESGGAVTTASAYANGKNGEWTNADVDSNGNFTLTLAGGEYEVCVSDKWDENGMVEKDWYIKWEDSCESISFDLDDTTEIKTADFKVQKADAKIKGIFKNKDGSFPVDGGWVSFWKDDLWFGGDVSSTDGSFSVAVIGGRSSLAATSFRKTSITSTTYQVQYQPHNTDEKTYWSKTEIDVNENQTLDLGVITLSEKDIAFTATVRDKNGNPIEGIYIDAWQENGGWSNEVTGADGKAMLYLYPGKWNIRPSTWDKPEYLYVGEEYRQEFESGDTSAWTFTVQKTSVNVTVNTRDAAGNIVEVNGWANCWSRIGDWGGFGGDIKYGTAEFGAIAGTYNCGVWTPENSDYQASGEKTVLFVDGQDVILDFVMQARTATANLFVKDQNNKLVKNQRGWVNASSDSGSWTDKMLGDDGTAQLRLAPGRYHFGVWFPEDSDYISSWSFDRGMSFADGETKSKTIEVNKITGTLKAKLLDADGKPVKHAWVGCGNYEELEDVLTADTKGAKLIESGASSGDRGIANVGLVAGHVYECWVGAPPESGMISPKSKRIDLTGDAHVEATFKFREANAKIKGEIFFGKNSEAARNGMQAEHINDLWCNGWAEEGYNTFDDSSDKSYTLAAIKGIWHIWCDGFVNNEDGSRTWYHAVEDKRVKVPGPGVYRNNNIKMIKSFFTIPESVSETFDSTQLTTLLIDANTTLTVPANALATEGNVTITAEPEMHAVHTFADTPFGIPWNFEAYDSNGVLISGNFNANVTLEITYDPAALEHFGIEESNILPKYWDESTGTWQNVSNAIQDMKNNTITFSLEHFSQVGLTYGTQTAQAQAKKKPPKKVRIKKGSRTSHGFTVLWKKRKAARKYRIEVSALNGNLIRSYKVKRRFRKKVVRGLKANKKYKFHVAQIIGGNDQKFSKWKKTSSKPARARDAFVERATLADGQPASIDFSFNQKKVRKNLEAVLMLKGENGEWLPFSLNGEGEGLEATLGIDSSTKLQSGNISIGSDYLGQRMRLVIKLVNTKRKNTNANTSKATRLLLVL